MNFEIQSDGARFGQARALSMYTRHTTAIKIYDVLAHLAPSMRKVYYQTMKSDTEAKLQRLRALDTTAISVISSALHDELTIKDIDRVAIAERHLDRTGVTAAKPSLSLLMPNIPAEALVGALSLMFGVVGLSGDEATKLNVAIQDESTNPTIPPATDNNTIEGEFTSTSTETEINLETEIEEEEDFAVKPNKAVEFKKPIPYDPKDKKNAPTKIPFVTEEGEYRIPEGFGEAQPKARKAKRSK